ncbi:MAG: hypothetical protein ACLFVJ_19980 [Persicimonas sp.]
MTPDELELILAAERLFAGRGIRAVTIDEILEEARGEASGAAELSKNELVEAISARHLERLASQWQAELDELATEDCQPTEILAAWLRPLVASVDDDAGSRWIRIAASMSTHPTYQLGDRPIMSSPAMARVLGLLVQTITRPPGRLIDARLHRAGATIYQSLAFRIRAERQGVARLPRELFVADLLDTVLAILAAPVSESTQALLDQCGTERDAADGGR